MRPPSKLRPGMDNLNQDLTSLLRRAGLDNSGGEWGSRILLVAGIVLVCYLAVKLFRHLVTPALQRISAQTRTMWDDHLFDDKVLHAACFRPSSYICCCRWPSATTPRC